MKKFLSLLISAVALVAFTPQVHAGYDAETATLRTNAVLASSAEALWAKIPCGGQKDVAVHIEFNMSAADTSAQTFVIARSVSGATNDVETLAAKTSVVGIAATGTTRSVTITNIPTLGSGTLYILYSTNAAASAYRTNLIVKYGEKTQAP
jgi:hypothetical protein